VVDHGAYGVDAARVHGARIHTLVLLAGAISSAILVNFALPPASTPAARVSEESGATPAVAPVVAHSLGIRVGAAGIRPARIRRRRRRQSIALHEGVSLVSWQALADDLVALNETSRVLPARTGARVLALILQAGQRGTALRVDDALAAASRWPADEVRQAGAGGRAVSRRALSVGAAGRRIARVLGLFDDGS